METLPADMLAEAPLEDRLEQDLRGRVRGRYCRSCPSSHYTSGNRVNMTPTRPRGRTLKWPGWTTDAILMYSIPPRADEPRMWPGLHYASEVKVIAPYEDADNQHVQVWYQGALTNARELQPVVEKYLAGPLVARNALFWITKHVPTKRIHIWIHEEVPRDLNIVADLDMTAGIPRGPTYYMLSNEEMLIANQGTPYHDGLLPMVITEAFGERSPAPNAAAAAGLLIDTALRRAMSREA